MKKILLYFLYSLTAHSQFVSKTWDKRFGGGLNDYCDAVLATSDGGYLLAGNTISNIGGEISGANQGGHDCWIIKIDANGIKLWDKRYGGTMSEGITSIVEALGSGYILSGNSSSNISGDKTENSRGVHDYWVIKIDANGNKIWDKTFGGTLDDKSSTIIKTSDGGYLLCGSSISNAGGDKTDNSQGSYDYWLVKIDANGNKLWDKRFGGSLTDYCSKIFATSDGGYMLGGYSNSPLDGDKTQNTKGDFDYWLIKIDLNGNKLWDKTYGGNLRETFGNIIEISSGGYLISGDSQSSANGDVTQLTKGASDYWILKIDASGTKIWDKRFGGNFVEQRCRSIVNTPTNGFIIAGSSNTGINGDKTEIGRGLDDFWLVKIDANGNKIWDKSYGGTYPDIPNAMIATTNDTYIVFGESSSDANGDKSDASRGGADFWAIKFIDCATLPVSLTLSGIASNGTKTASQSIISSQTVNNDINVTYKAGSSITLSPAFNVQTGGVFIAQIGTGCS